MHISNMYEVLEDGIAAPDDLALRLTPPESDYDRDERIYNTQFDLVQIESKFGRPKIFTRELLQQIKSHRFAISTELQKSQRNRKLPDLHYSTSVRAYKVFSHDEDYDSADGYDCVSVRFMSRIELHPDFQRYYWRFSRTNCQLRVINELQGKPDWLPIPYSLTLDEVAYSAEHLDKEAMQGYWDALQNTKRLWLKSESRRRLLRTMTGLAAKHKSITKIICLGLGALRHDKAFYESSLQHMATFSIAKQLEKAYQSPIQVILQDPCYMEKDRKLLRGLFGKGSLAFVSDPDGLLAIDSETIVMTAFLPVGYPLLQIIADIFQDTLGEGPAAIICDSMEIDPSRKLYKWTDRSSPAVARFLTKQYSMQNFIDHVLEEELAEDMHGDEERSYWLSKMQLFTRN